MVSSVRVAIASALIVLVSQGCTFLFDDGSQAADGGLLLGDAVSVTKDGAPPVIVDCPTLVAEAEDVDVSFVARNNDSNGHCYAFYKNRNRNADTAEMACVDYAPEGTKGHLVSITSEAEYEFVKGLTGFGNGQHENFWIGLNDKAVEDNGAEADQFVFTNGETLPMLDDLSLIPEEERWKGKWHKWNRQPGQTNGPQPNDFKDADNDMQGEDCVWQGHQEQHWLDIACQFNHTNQILCEFELK